MVPQPPSKLGLGFLFHVYTMFMIAYQVTENVSLGLMRLSYDTKKGCDKRTKASQVSLNP
jgi:hypothetical protein